ncbi:MAG TPA: hypothetical protein VKX28_09470 [Xanthobacteraceae bacterium]|nr:hypothetical protein [Xanthobacteraceae bacterium]
MTPYTPSDVAEGWEFKILRSATGGFGNPAKLQSVLDAEQRAGWTLLEKFDNGRMRLKRPAKARAGDATLDFDPMRTWVGMKPGILALLIVCGSLASSGLIVLAVLWITGVLR